MKKLGFSIDNKINIRMNKVASQTNGECYGNHEGLTNLFVLRPQPERNVIFTICGRIHMWQNSSHKGEEQRAIA